MAKHKHVVADDAQAHHEGEGGAIMSEVTSRTEESQSRAYDLREEIETKLSQATGICTLIGGAGGDKAISEAASAATELLDDVQEAFKELLDIYKVGPRTVEPTLNQP
jgi:hypothetical protein